MEAAGEAEGAAGPGGRRAGLRHRRPVAEMLDLPFLPFCAFLGGLGFVCVAFVSAWCQHWRGGFAWDGSAQMFNWHPVLMVTGMVVLYGAAALVYRLPPAWRGPKFPWKVLHGALALAAFVLAVLGLVAVFRFHNDNGTPNMYSLHSWLGLATVLLFSCQWVAGFSAFLLPWAPTWLRALYKPIHVFFGSIILLLSVASCVSGINEKLFFSLMGRRRTSSCLLRLFLPTLWVSSSSSLGCWSWAPCPGRAGSALTPTPRTLASPCSPPSADACRGLSLPSRDCQPRALHPRRSPACSASPAFGLSPCPHRGLHLPVSDAHLPAGGTGTASLTAETCCGEDVSLPLSWPGVGFLPAVGWGQPQRDAPACVLGSLLASSCQVQLAPCAWTSLRAKLAALEPSPDHAAPSLNAAAGAVRASSDQKPPEEHPCAWQRCCPPTVSCARVPSSGQWGQRGPSHRALPFIGLFVPLPSPRGCGDQLSSLPGLLWTRNKPLASAALLRPRPWGQGGYQGLGQEWWVPGEQVSVLAEPSHALWGLCPL